MGKQFNIKDAETIRLARALADASGETMTATIRRALEREYRERENRIEEALAVVREIGAKVRANMPPEWTDKTSREIVKDFHEQEWQEQYGPES